jgi:hypothetical protein
MFSVVMARGAPSSAATKIRNTSTLIGERIWYESGSTKSKLGGDEVI